MKIASYGIGMSSSSVTAKSYSAVEKSTINTGAAAGRQQLQIIGMGSFAKAQDRVVISANGEGAKGLNFNAPQNAPQNNTTPPRGNTSAQLMEALGERASDLLTQGKDLSVRSTAPGFQTELPDKHKMMLMMLERLTEALTGKKQHFKMPSVNPFENAPRSQGYVPPFQSFIVNNNPNTMIMNAQQQPPQAMATVQRTETYQEFQSMSFSASGVINTADGRQIEIAMNVNMSYEFYSQNSSTIEQAVQIGNLCDPLVINFDGNLPEFTDDRYSFDINIGGDMENIFMPTGGSGFLAYDKNGNGAIDDGSELFGATTGNGFAELAAYDGDGNGWIDENDLIFEALKIMSVDKKTGEFMMVSLKDAGIGAIFLGSVASNFELSNSNNETQGIVRRNGFFLFENGGAGSIQHIDLTY
jgi:hypothetical protein